MTSMSWTPRSRSAMAVGISTIRKAGRAACGALSSRPDRTAVLSRLPSRGRGAFRDACSTLQRGNGKIGPLQHRMFRRAPWTQAIARTLIYWFLEFIGLAFFGNALVNRWLTGIALRKLRREVHDPSTRAKLTTSYTIGCKRILLADDFYPAFNRTNVELVTENIEEILPNHVRTSDGRDVAVDVIVLATGFIVADTDGY